MADANLPIKNLKEHEIIAEGHHPPTLCAGIDRILGRKDFESVPHASRSWLTKRLAATGFFDSAAI
jgi:hypothetical protein